MLATSLLLKYGGRAPLRRRLFQTPPAAAEVAPAARKVESILFLYKSKSRLNSIDMIIRIRRKDSHNIFDKHQISPPPFLSATAPTLR